MKWHKVSEEAKDAFIAFHKQKLSVPNVMIAEQGVKKPATGCLLTGQFARTISGPVILIKD